MKHFSFVKMNSNIFVMMVFGIVSLTEGSEWFTSGGLHCITKCEIGKRAGSQDDVYWCPAVDGFNSEHRPGSTSRPSAHDVDVENQILWDYCTPAPVASVVSDEENGFIDVENQRPPVNRTKRQIGGFNPGQNILVPSSYPGVDCVEACTSKGIENKTTCRISEKTDETFYCSRQMPLERKQVSSHTRVWCTGPCLKKSGRDYYECNTLFGKDRCSPSSDTSAKGKTCFSPCKNENGRHKCHIDDLLTKLDDCGKWSHSKVGMKALEYTVDNQVCAGPCELVDENLMCSYVEWEWEDEFKVSTLSLKMGSCDHSPSSGTNWTVIGIVIGCVIVAIVAIVVVGGVIWKRKYSPVATGNV